jgi:hypothetical protein
VICGDGWLNRSAPGENQPDDSGERQWRAADMSKHLTHNIRSKAKGWDSLLKKTIKVNLVVKEREG